MPELNIWKVCACCEKNILSHESTYYSMDIPHCSNYCRIHNKIKIKEKYDILYPPRNLHE